MEALQQVLDSTNLPVLSAFVLGLMMAISPCPLATNITAIGYIGRNLENRRAVFVNGLLYTLGRVISYTALGVAIYFGAETFDVSRLFQGWGERLLGPLLIVIGVFMLDIIPLRFSFLDRFTAAAGEKSGSGAWGALLLGMIFALAFCPYSGVLYFVMLIPMSVASAGGLYLPAVFAIATGLPVIVAAWFIAFTVSGVGQFYNRLKSFERWFRRIVAVLFILAGIYLISLFLFPTV